MKSILNKDKPIHAYYFSGTGNTERMAFRFAEVLKEKGYSLSLERMESATISSEKENDYTLGLIFPVAIQSTFPLVWNFVKNLPRGENREVFMFDTMQSYSGGIVGPMKRVLKSKGYRCIGAREFKMSSSMNTASEKVDSGKKTNKKAMDNVEKYALDLIIGKTRWSRVPIFSDLMRSFSLGKSMWKVISSQITVTDRCIGCRVCIRKCPTKSIELTSDKVSINHETCNACMRCVSVCPQKAFLFGGKELKLSR